jgi:hypothetical protein
MMDGPVAACMYMDGDWKAAPPVRTSPWKRFVDWLFPWCPSGLPHRVNIGTVDSFNGKKWCWHSMCMRASHAEVLAEETRLRREDQEQFARVIAQLIAQEMKR